MIRPAVTPHPRPSMTPKIPGIVILALALLGVSWMTVLLSADRSLNPYDEGVILTGAMRVASGAIPHRDFYANYGPGEFYVLALLFKIFHPSVLIGRLFGACVKAALVLSVFLIGGRLLPRLGSLACCLIALVWLSYVGNTVWPAWTALALSLMSCLPLLTALEGRGSRASLLAGGVTLGLATLFRYDIGFLVFCAELTVLSGYCLFTRREKQGWLHALRPAVMFLGGVCIVATLTALLYVATGSVKDFIFDVVSFPAHYYAKTRSLPFPWPFSATEPNTVAEYVVYFPVLASAAGLLAALNSLKEGVGHDDVNDVDTRNHTLTWELLLLSLVTLGFFAKGLVRVSALHMSLAVIPGSVVFVSGIVRLRRSNTSLGALLAIASIVLFVPTLAALGDVYERISANLKWAARFSLVEYRNPESYVANGSCHPSPGFESVVCIAVSADEVKAIQYLRSQTHPNDCVFVGLPQHQRIFVNNVGFYFVSGLSPATKWYHFDPGLQTNENTQQQIVADLERNKPRFAVLDSQWENIHEPNASAESTDVHLLDEYIATHFQKVADFGSLAVLKSEAQVAE